MLFCYYFKHLWFFHVCESENEVKETQYFESNLCVSVSSMAYHQLQWKLYQNIPMWSQGVHIKFSLVKTTMIVCSICKIWLPMKCEREQSLQFSLLLITLYKNVPPLVILIGFFLVKCVPAAFHCARLTF